MTQQTQPAAGRVESHEWLETYGDDTQSARRRRMMPRKLHVLGLDTIISKDAAVLDLCCGHGETLDVLYELGCRDLTGVDIHVPESLRAEPRFKVVEGDASEPDGVLDESMDWILCLHALHHLETPERIKTLMDSAFRILKPGGRLSFIDFPNSVQIRAAFWFFRHFKPLLVTPYLKWFGTIVEEEWPFLQYYLPKFPQVWQTIHDDRRFQVEIERHELFYFFLTVRKPLR
ncbi:MAG TPA: class I SAM-dependent methyltransferase [Candidatus Baltobacteraceae bacterium]|jgi:ubiquinone/menaquinone biosynthesis C-methylase UbiE|nr:class I SAM-dependent methyltransferase [Candidatus Baltobacteraceae bacterium]